MLCCEMGFELGQTPFEEEKVISFGDPISDMCCSTGDNFVNDTSNMGLIADVVDMEAYALAKVAQSFNIPFQCYKYVSDFADEDAAETWQQNVAKGADLFTNIL